MNETPTKRRWAVAAMAEGEKCDRIFLGMRIATDMDEAKDLFLTYCLKEHEPCQVTSILAARIPDEIADDPPCQVSCCKCGGSDIYIRFFQKDENVDGATPSGRWPATEWVARNGTYNHRALKDCLVNACRTCGFNWDSDPLQE